MKITEIKNRFQTRKINQQYVDFLAEDFKANGFKNAYPVSITEDGVLWDGNHRVEAAIKVGLAEIPHIIETPENMRQAAHENNRTASNHILSKVLNSEIKEIKEVLFNEGEYVWIPIKNIKETFSVRKENKAFVDILKKSISDYGYVPTPCVCVTKHGVLWDGNQRLAALKDLGHEKIHAYISTPENIRYAAHMANTVCNNSFDSFLNEKYPPYDGLESQLEDEFCGSLNVPYQRQVHCAVGIADVVTDTHIYELKRHLSKTDIISAVGQVLLYRACINPNAKAVIVGCEEKNTQSMIEYVKALGVEVNIWEQ